jgi:hypothetical protein
MDSLDSAELDSAELEADDEPHPANVNANTAAAANTAIFLIFPPVCWQIHTLDYTRPLGQRYSRRPTEQNARSWHGYDKRRQLATLLRQTTVPVTCPPLELTASLFSCPRKGRQLMNRAGFLFFVFL